MDSRGGVDLARNVNTGVDVVQEECRGMQRRCRDGLRGGRRAVSESRGSV
jgi:hypothetical protein